MLVGGGLRQGLVVLEHERQVQRAALRAQCVGVGMGRFTACGHQSGLPEVAVVDGQVRLGDLQLEQVGSARELQRGRLGCDAPARRQDVGDVLGAEGLQFQPSSSARAIGLLAVQLGQGDDLAQVHAGVHALGLQPLEVGRSAWRQRQEVHQQTLLARGVALGQQLPRVLGVFDVLVPIHAARMARDELPPS